MIRRTPQGLSCLAWQAPHKVGASAAGGMDEPNTPSLHQALRRMNAPDPWRLICIQTRMGRVSPPASPSVQSLTIAGSGTQMHPQRLSMQSQRPLSKPFAPLIMSGAIPKGLRLLSCQAAMPVGGLLSWQKTGGVQRLWEA